ncbi:MAG: 50S ribosomal protein L29 [Candidatus Levybacteria bacterium]|nr:50S ribosomal protein L29 [Candidatus Levybacteria bacterium]
MKTKNKKEISTRTIQELKGLLKEAKDLLFSLRLEKSQNKLKNTRSIFLKRKEIAQILTLIRQKEIIPAGRKVNI